ncbi:hypothetical protein E2C01_042673 [Portunus trituberculatus]|uniref:Uncharacterized protein n=1 Tax=Portunus trituberculatus TaxID=210409 RepID=A0A5B7FU16_PORTR|nr:hypothetical protein [Portunus trituberculatus]
MLCYTFDLAVSPQGPSQSSPVLSAQPSKPRELVQDVCRSGEEPLSLLYLNL